MTDAVGTSAKGMDDSFKTRFVLDAIVKAAETLYAKVITAVTSITKQFRSQLAETKQGSTQQVGAEKPLDEEADRTQGLGH